MSRAKGIILIIVIVLITNLAQGFVWMKMNSNLETKLTTEIATLNATIDSIGPPTTVWTVSGKVDHGDEIKSTSFTQMTIPQSMVNENYIIDTASITGQFFKIAVNPGTPLTKDMIMADALDDTTRDVDIYVDRWTAGLKAGDYVDCELILPYGDSYTVLSHKRIQSVGSGTLKVYLTAAERHTYDGACVDYYLNVQKGASLYVDRYVEPGIQKPAKVYYAVPKNIEAVMLADPNIVNKAQDSINSSFRSTIDAILDQFKTDATTVETEAGLLNAGRSKYNTSVAADSSIFTNDAGTDTSTSGESDPLGDVFEEETVVNPDGTTTTNTVDTGAGVTPVPSNTTQEGGTVE